jgi:hypothetical protein
MAQHFLMTINAETYDALNYYKHRSYPSNEASYVVWLTIGAECANTGALLLLGLIQL